LITQAKDFTLPLWWTAIGLEICLLLHNT